MLHYGFSLLSSSPETVGPTTWVPPASAITPQVSEATIPYRLRSISPVLLFIVFTLVRLEPMSFLGL